MPTSGHTSKPARFINPPNRLKAKVGTGGIDTSLLDKAQHYIDTAKLDFISYAQRFLNEMSETALEAKNNNANKDAVILPVMQLKANGGMFQYQLVSDIADTCLNFLETIQEFNNDAYNVVKIHESTINVIITNQLKGDGGQEGLALLKELDQACKRYFSKHKKPE